MFKQLKIKNFKSHENTILDFSPGMNVFLGRSQAGKTNILRSLLLLIHNRPGGAKFFSNFAGKKGTTKVQLTLDDNSEITLSKDIKINKKGEKIVVNTAYDIKSTLNQNHFEGFGASVPDIIKEKLNLSELNIQKQFDTPFLILASAGEIAKTINRVTKLEKVDKWVSDLTSNINQYNQQNRIQEEENVNLKKDLVKFKNIDKAEQHVALGIKLTNEIQLLIQRKANIQNLVQQLNDINKTIDKTREALKVKNHVVLINKLNDEISRSIILENNLLDLIDLENKISIGKPVITKIEKGLTKIDKFDNEISKSVILEDKLSNFVNIKKEISVKKPIHTKIEIKIKKIVGFMNSLNRLYEIKYRINNFITNNEIYISASQKHSETKSAYIDLLIKIGKCPLCWNKIDKQCIEAIEGEL